MEISSKTGYNYNVLYIFTNATEKLEKQEVN